VADLDAHSFRSVATLAGGLCDPVWSMAGMAGVEKISMPIFMFFK
jgi:hypothetical protein